MTPQQFRTRSIALLSSFALRCAAVGKNDAEFEFTSGLSIHVFFPHRREYTRTLAPAWVHFDLNELGEQIGRKLACRPLAAADYCWWKWNINYGGRPSEQRAAVFAELQRRVQRCLEHQVIFPAASAPGESPDSSGVQSVHDTRSGGDSISRSKDRVAR